MSFQSPAWFVPSAMQADLIAAIGIAAGALGMPLPTGTPTAPQISVSMLHEGAGLAAAAGDRVTVHFVVRTQEGKELANSYKRGMPYTVEIGEAGSFWLTVLDGVRVGGTSRLAANSSEFFGKGGVASVIPPDTLFLADVKLLKVEKAMVARKSEPAAKIGQR